MDGLAAIPPIGDPDYAAARGNLAPAGALPLNGRFALHPSLPNLHAMYGSGELLCIHAVATPYRERSHFDAQNMLETGAATPFARAEGWLGKALTHLPRRRLAITGAAREPISALESAFLTQARAATSLLRSQNGPIAAAVEMSGWDTHADQAQALAHKFRRLDEGLAAIKTDLGAYWRSTVVVVATEFGRTIAPNAAGGTDHGTASAAFLLGGAVAGGRVLADWPGLAARALREGQSLAPTTDLRAVFKGVLSDHLSLANAALNRDIFPGAERTRPLQGLVRG